MFELTWQEFSRRSHIVKLPIHEQIRQYQFAQQQFIQQQQYIINNIVAHPTGGPTININSSTNSYIDDYVDDYFE